MIWPQFCSRAPWRSSFDSWARALAKLAVTNEFSSFALTRRITTVRYNASAYIKEWQLCCWKIDSINGKTESKNVMFDNFINLFTNAYVQLNNEQNEWASHKEQHMYNYIWIW